MYDLIAFKDDQCVRHVYNNEEGIIEDLLYKGYVVYRADTRQVAVAILQSSVAWIDVIVSPMPYKHDPKRTTMLNLLNKESCKNAQQ